MSQSLDMGVDKPLKNLVEDTEQRYQSITFWVPQELNWLWNDNYKFSSPDLGNFELVQARRKEQGFKAAPAWIINSGQMESGPKI